MLICFLGILNTLAIGKLILPLEILIDFAFFFFAEASICPVHPQAARPGPVGRPVAAAVPALRLLRGDGRGAPAAGPPHSWVWQRPPRCFLQAGIGFLPGV